MHTRLQKVRLYVFLEKKDKWKIVTSSKEFTSEIKKRYDEIETEKMIICWTIMEGLVINMISTKKMLHESDISWYSLPSHDRTQIFNDVYETIFEYMNAPSSLEL